ncbi:Uncharacterised protein [Mycobacteroides abscessus]|nr:Uncharacterised protein [Mycobacteroides abscessus]
MASWNEVADTSSPSADSLHHLSIGERRRQPGRSLSSTAGGCHEHAQCTPQNDFDLGSGHLGSGCGRHRGREPGGGPRVWSRAVVGRLALSQPLESEPLELQDSCAARIRRIVRPDTGRRETAEFRRAFLSRVGGRRRGLRRGRGESNSGPAGSGWLQSGCRTRVTPESGIHQRPLGYPCQRPACRGHFRQSPPRQRA